MLGDLFLCFTLYWVFVPLDRPGVCEPARHIHRHKCQSIQTKRDIYPSTWIFLQVSWLPNVGVFPANINS